MKQSGVHDCWWLATCVLSAAHKKNRSLSVERKRPECHNDGHSRAWFSLVGEVSANGLTGDRQSIRPSE